MRRLASVVAVLALLGALLVVALVLYTATVRPTVRRLAFVHPALAAGQPPLRLVLIADLHATGPDMPPRRLDGLVAGINRLQPDCVLIAGDFVSDRHLSTRIVATDAAVAPSGGCVHASR